MCSSGDGKRLQGPVCRRPPYATDRSEMNFSVSPGSLDVPAPLLGEHTSYVLKDLIGLTDEEYTSLEEDGVLE